MNKSLLLAASLAMMVSLTGCPSTPTQPNPGASPSASATPSAEPTPSMDPGASATPDPTPTTEPTAGPTALPTVDPGGNVGFSLTSATATKQPNFSYRFVITGTGLGAVADYNQLQVQSSDATITLVENGQAKAANVELKEMATIAGNQLSFTWLPPNGAPTNNDMIKLTYGKKGGEAGLISTNVRLTVN
ncbi:MAG: hypothetical protein ACO1RX_15755 [Candidatus Sericytochromatia bacterium]